MVHRLLLTKNKFQLNVGDNSSMLKPGNYPDEGKSFCPVSLLCRTFKRFVSRKLQQQLERIDTIIDERIIDDQQQAVSDPGTAL